METTVHASLKSSRVIHIVMEVNSRFELNSLIIKHQSTMLTPEWTDPSLRRQDLPNVNDVDACD